MYEKIKSLAKQYYPETVAIRRDLHKYPEQGWLEMRTASLVAKKTRKAWLSSINWKRNNV